MSTAAGGAGGSGPFRGAGVAGGNGGDATAAATAIGGSGPVNVSASAIGGAGGFDGGSGGSAQLSNGGAGPAVFGQSSGGPVVVEGSVTTGNADSTADFIANGVSVTLSNAVGGSTTGALT
jgi:hypothetical protein